MPASSTNIKFSVCLHGEGDAGVEQLLLGRQADGPAHEQNVHLRGAEHSYTLYLYAAYCILQYSCSGCARLLARLKAAPTPGGGRPRGGRWASPLRAAHRSRRVSMCTAISPVIASLAGVAAGGLGQVLALVINAALGRLDGLHMCPSHVTADNVKFASLHTLTQPSFPALTYTDPWAHIPPTHVSVRIMPTFAWPTTRRAKFATRG